MVKGKSMNLGRFILLVVLALALPTSVSASIAQAFTDREYIRNGSFSTRIDDWGYNEMSAVTNVGAGSDPVLVIKTFLSRGPASVWQEIYLPTRTDAARLSFDYRMVPGVYASYGGQLLAGFLKYEGGQWVELISWPVTPVVTGDTGWQHFQRTLSSNEVTALQAARQAGQHVIFLLQLRQNEQDAFQAYVDNVSLKLDGEMVYPQLSGRIAFRGIDAQGRYTIVSADPLGRDRRLVWTSPEAGGKFLGLAWKPDGKEIAFASDHEFGYSPFHADIYRVSLSGQMRRLTNPPGHNEMQSDGYGKGTVRGQVHNGSTRNLTGISVYVQGAMSPVALGPLAPGATVNFTLPNVADLGAGKGQYAILIWFDANCARGLYPVPGTLIDVRAGATVNAGALTFVGNDCTQFEAAGPVWRPDGAVVGFTMGGAAQKVDMTGNLSAPFSTDALGLSSFTWSPRNDGAILYTANPGVYQTREGGGRGTLLVDAGATGVSARQAAWLPDGSGFVFTDGMNLFLYRFAGGQLSQLTTLNLHRHTDQLALGIEPLGALAVSPDGKYVLFERSSPNVLNGRDLWMLNLDNPVEVWPVTNDGRSAYPDWVAGAGGQPTRRVYLPTILSGK